LRYILYPNTNENINHPAHIITPNIGVKNIHGNLLVATIVYFNTPIAILIELKQHNVNNKIIIDNATQIQPNASYIYYYFISSKSV